MNESHDNHKQEVWEIPFKALAEGASKDKREDKDEEMKKKSKKSKSRNEYKQIAISSKKIFGRGIL